MNSQKLVLYYICSWKKAFYKCFNRLSYCHIALFLVKKFYSSKELQLFFFSECHLLSQSFMHAFFAIKGLSLVKENKSRFLARNFLVEPKSGDVICDKCRKRHYRQKEQNTSKTVNCTESCGSDDDYTPPTSKPRRDNHLSSPNSVRLSIPSTSKTNSYCFLCRIQGRKLTTQSKIFYISAQWNYNSCW